MNKKTIFFFLLFFTFIVFLLQGFNFKKMFRKEEFPRPHPIKFTEKDFIELTITSFFKYLNQKQILPALEFVSVTYTDNSSGNFNECKREIKNFVEVKRFQRVDVDYSNFEVSVNGNTSSVKFRVKKQSPNNEWKEIIFELEKIQGIWKIISFSCFFEILNESEQKSTHKKIGLQGGKK